MAHSPPRAALSFVFGLLVAGLPALAGVLGCAAAAEMSPGAARGCTPTPENQVKPEGAFSAGRVAWGGAGSHGGGAEHLGRAVAGTRRCNPFIWAKDKKSKNDALKEPLYSLVSVWLRACTLVQAAECYWASALRRNATRAAGTAATLEH